MQPNMPWHGSTRPAEVKLGLTIWNVSVKAVCFERWDDIPDHLASYIDMDAIAHDLAHDYTETEVAGERLIYRAA